MYLNVGMFVSSQHRESTDSLINIVHVRGLDCTRELAQTGELPWYDMNVHTNGMLSAVTQVSFSPNLC